MGPHSFKCGKRNPGQDSGADHGSFNGAALFQVRKVEVIDASGFFTPRLQWGRTLSSAESIGTARPGRALTARFNGAALFQVRKAYHCNEVSRACLALQWGRTLSSAESDSLRFKVAVQEVASMGPHSFKCGKLPNDIRRSGFSVRASMGPHSFKCGKRGISKNLFRTRMLLQWGRTLSSAESA